jgi:hypothetical protein
MPDYSYCHGKVIALVLTDSEEESAVFYGIASWDGERLLLKRTGDKPDFEIREEWRERIRPVPQGEAKRILDNADFMLRLSVGLLPGQKGQFEETGLKWPE